MGYNLARIARRQMGSRRKIATLPTTNLPKSLEKELAAIYVKVVRAWSEQAADLVLSNYEDRHLTTDSARGIEHGLEQSDGFLGRLVVSLTPALRDWLVRVEQWHRKRFISAAKTATTVELGTVIGPEGAQETMAAALARNIELIRSVSDDMRKRISESVWHAFTTRQPRREAAKAVNAAVQIGRDRALRIASDQTTKLSATLDQERQREAGITQFIWRHSGKVHFRPEHKARDGKVYSWGSNDLQGDLPGVAINCGCKAQAYIDLMGATA